MAGRTPFDPGDFAQAFAEAWATRDGAEIAALFTEDADFVNVTGLGWTGRERIARAHDIALKSFFSKTVLTPGRTDLRMLGETHAVLRCRFHMTGQTAPDGSEAGARQTILTFVLQKQGAGWLAVAAQNTDVVPGQETMLSTGDGIAPVRYR